MRILLDSKDLINVLEKGRPVSIARLESALRAGNHQLVLSYVNVTELVAPLQFGREFTDIRSILVAVEDLPVVKIHQAIVAFDDEINM
jgi:hypothetical protein